MENSEANKLTKREEYILQLLIRGYENSEIAKELFISKHTVKAHISAILKKLSVRNRTQAVYIALKSGVIN